MDIEIVYGKEEDSNPVYSQAEHNIFKAKIKEHIKIFGGCLCYVWSSSMPHINPNRKIMLVRELSETNNLIYNDGWSCVHYEFAEPIKIVDFSQYLV